MNDKQITIKDEKGKEIVFNILFTFENNKTKYVLCFEKDEEDTIIPFKYDDDGNAFAVENADELDLIQEFLDAYDKAGDDNEKNN